MYIQLVGKYICIYSWYICTLSPFSESPDCLMMQDYTM